MADIAIGVVGCAGRMGQALLRQIAAADGCRIAGGSEAPGHPAVGQDVAGLIGAEALGLAVTDVPQALFEASDVVLDFTIPKATMQHIALAHRPAPRWSRAPPGWNRSRRPPSSKLQARSPSSVPPT